MFEGILQPTHLLLILLIVLVMFGPQKLPQVGRGLGEAIRGFREGLRSSGKSNQGEIADSQPTQHPRSNRRPLATTTQPRGRPDPLTTSAGVYRFVRRND